MEGPGGTTLFDVPGGAAPDRRTRRRRRGCCRCGTASCSPTPIAAGSIPPDYRRLVIRMNGDVPADAARRRLRRRGVASGRGRHRGHGVPQAVRRGVERGSRRRPRALVAFLADRDTHRLSPLRPLVGRAAGRRGSAATGLASRLPVAAACRDSGPYHRWMQRRRPNAVLVALASLAILTPALVEPDRRPRRRVRRRVREPDHHDRGQLDDGHRRHLDQRGPDRRRHVPGRHQQLGERRGRSASPPARPSSRRT